MNVVLIGYGYWGPNIAKNIYKSKKMNLYAICDANEQQLMRAKSIYGNEIKYVKDYHELQNNGDEIDAFAIALRQDISFPIAKELLSLGYNLFMEKPLALTTNQVEMLGRISEEKKVILHTDHIMVFHPIIRYIKRMIESGELGELLYFDISRMNLGPHIKNDINVMWDLSVHDLAVLDYLCDGMEAKKVNAVGMGHYSKREELTYLTVEYDDFVASIRSSWISPLKERRMIIGGTKKMVIFDDMKIDEKLMIYDKGFDINESFVEYGKYESKVRDGDLFIPHMPQEDILLNSLEHFADCIQNKKESIANWKQAYRVISILERADQMIRAIDD